MCVIIPRFSRKIMTKTFVSRKNICFHSNDLMYAPVMDIMEVSHEGSPSLVQLASPAVPGRL